MDSRWWIWIAAVVAGILPAALTGCGSEQDDSTLTVALTGEYPPFSMYDSQGELAGFDVDVSRAIAARIGQECEFQPTKWSGILPGLLAGKYDCIIGSMAVTPERSQEVSFSEPYYVSGAQLFIRSDLQDEIRSIDDCDGQAVGVGLGETYEHYLQNNYPQIDVRTYTGAPDIFSEMENGRLVGFVTDRLVGAYQINQAGRSYIPAGPLLYRETIAIPVRPDRTELLDEINAALAEMRASGELEQIRQKWFGDVVEEME